MSSKQKKLLLLFLAAVLLATGAFAVYCTWWVPSRFSEWAASGETRENESVAVRLEATPGRGDTELSMVFCSGKQQTLKSDSYWVDYQFLGRWYTVCSVTEFILLGSSEPSPRYIPLQADEEMLIPFPVKKTTFVLPGRYRIRIYELGTCEFTVA